MNRFVRNFLLLPFIFLVFLFHIGLVVGCTCGTPRPGQEIEIVLRAKSTDPKKPQGVKLTSDNYTTIFKKLLLDVNLRYFWSLKEKVPPLVVEMKKDLSVDAKNQINDFEKDFFSSRNNRFSHFVINSDYDIGKGSDLNDKKENLPEFINDKNQYKEELGDLKVDAYFYVANDNKYWKIEMMLSGIKMKLITNKDQKLIESFDLKELKDANFKVNGLKLISAMEAKKFLE